MSYRTKQKPILKNRGRNRSPRPKTFKTEEAAHAYAKELGLKSYDLVNLKPEHAKASKLKVVEK